MSGSFHLPTLRLLVTTDLSEHIGASDLSYQMMRSALFRWLMCGFDREDRLDV